MTDEEVLERANRAEIELRETEAAFDKLREAMVEKLFSTTLENRDLRERLFVAVQALDTVRQMLREAVSAGAIVNHTTLLAQHGFQR